MAVILSRCACLLAFLAVLGAEEPVLTLTADASALRQDLAQAKPGPAWDPPGGTVARGAILRDLPDLLGLPAALVTQPSSIVVAGTLAGDGRHLGAACVVSPAGSCTAALPGWTRSDPADGVLLTTGVPVTSPVAGKGPFSMWWSADGMLAAGQRAQGAVLPELVALRPWLGATGSVSVAISLSANSWRGEMTARCDRPLPLRPLDPSLASLADAGQALRLAAGVDPASLAVVLEFTLPWDAKRGLRDAIGLSPTDLAVRLTGDGYAQVRLDGFMPRGAAIVLGRSGADLADLARGIADAFRGQPVPDLPGGHRLDTPIGPLLLVAQGQRLVAGNDEALVRAWLAGTPGSAPLDPHRALVVEADLPAMAPFLPLLGTLKFDQPRIPGAIDRDGGLLADATLARVQAGGRDFGEALSGASLPIARPSGSGTVRLPPAVALALAAELAEARLSAGGSSSRPMLAPGSATAGELDSRFAWYAPAADPVRHLVLVFRSEHGWHVLEDWRRGWTRPLNRGALGSRLAAMGCPRAVGGADVDHLPVSMLPPALSEWLPPLVTLAPQLPPWQLHVDAQPGGLTAAETGLPLASAGIAWSCWWAWSDLTPRLAVAAGGDGFQ